MPTCDDRVVGLRRKKDGLYWILGTPVSYSVEHDTRLIGMPTGVSLFVWLPDRRAKWAEMDAERTRQIRAAFGR